MADISKITLPSGTTYDIKDAVARAAIAQGVTFIMAWSGTNYAQTTEPTTAQRALVPDGVTMYYNSGASSTTGTLAASGNTKGKFYLVFSKTVLQSDIYDEYITVERQAQSATAYDWEKIGDTQVDLSNVVTGVTLNKQTTNFVTDYASPTTDKVLGESTTFALTSGSVTHGTPSKDNVLGEATTFNMTQPTITVTPSTTRIKATASGTAVGADGTESGIVSLGTPLTESVIGSVDVATSKLVTSSISEPVYNGAASYVTATPKTASKATAGTAKNVATTGTTVTKVMNNLSKTNPSGGAASGNNANLLAGVTVSGETLSIGYATFTETSITPAVSNGSITPYTFTDVVASAVDITSVTGLAKAGSKSITYATGQLSSTGSGATIVNSVTPNVADYAAVAGYPNTTSATFLKGVKVTAQPTIALATGATAGTGVVSVATGISSATATGGAVTAGTNDVVAAVTAMPTSSVGTGITVGTNDKVTALTGLGTATKSAGLNNSTTITVTKGE